MALGYAAFFGLFKLAVAEDAQPCDAGGVSAGSGIEWAQFSNAIRPHGSLEHLSPDQFAQEHGLPAVPSITVF